MGRRTDVSGDDRTQTYGGDAAGGSRARVLVFWDGGSLARTLAGGETVITFGRGAECDMQVTHASVSRRHAALRPGAPATIEDLGSANGTWIGGRRLDPNSPSVIHAGEIVRIGGATLLLELPAEPPLSVGPPPSRPPSPVIGQGARIGHPAPATDGVMARTQRLIELVAASSLSVLITGETGVGKEIAARQVHDASPRRARPFVAINCAALPEALLESELFGHEKGAFTGASAAKPGLIEAADRGTLFLDEVGDMPAAAQSKLLRVLESREVRRLGALAARAVDVRFIAATHRDLSSRVAQGAFREDLFYRLNVASVWIPPLRERRSEIAPLCALFAAGVALALGRLPPRLDPAALAILEAHPWPGNVRQLRNVIERAVVVCEGGAIGIEHLANEVLADSGPPAATPPATAVPSGEVAAVAADLQSQLAEIERRRILTALDRCAGHQGRAAEALGISRRTLINRMEAYGLPRPRKGHDPAKR
jgi:DNA-binding NtrC family response regulator